jgi:predicted Zn finger-like uncharacterized protein
MPFKTPCPHCGASCNLTDQARGKRVRCGGCSETFVAPAQSDEGYVGEASRPVRRPGPGIRREGALEPPLKAGLRSRRRRDEEEDEDFEDDSPRRRRRAAGGMNPKVLGPIIGGGVLVLVLALGVVLWLVITGKDSPEPQPVAGTPVQPGPVQPGQGNPPRGVGNRPGRPLPRPAPVAPAVWNVSVDPAPGGQPLADLPNLALPVRLGNDVVFPTGPSPFVAIGRNIVPNDSRVLYDLRTGQPVATLGGKLGGYFKSAVSPDGEYFAGIPSLSLQAVDIWSFKTRQKVGHLDTGITGFIQVMDFAGPGQIVTAGTGNQQKKVFQVWDVKTGQVIREIQGSRSYYGPIAALSPGRRYLALFARRAFHVFDLRTGGVSELAIPNADVIGSAQGIAFSPDGTLLAVYLRGPGNGRILAVDVAAGRVVVDLTCSQAFNDLHYQGPALEWLPDNSGWLVKGDTVLDRATGKPRFSVAGAGIKTRIGPTKVISKTQLLVVRAGQGFTHSLTTVSFAAR